MMKKTTTTRYDTADHLRSPEEVAAYLEATFEEANGDAAFIAKALGHVARSKGMAKVAREAGLSRESLYKALSPNGNPSLATVVSVLSSLGLRLNVETINPRSKPAARPSPSKRAVKAAAAERKRA